MAGMQAELRAREQSHAHSIAALETTAASLHASLAALQTQVRETVPLSLREGSLQGTRLYTLLYTTLSLHS